MTSGGVQHVNSPSPATLAQVARLLGDDYAAKPDLEGRVVILVRGNPAWRQCSDGDLLLACLTKAAEMGLRISLKKGGFHTETIRWCAEFEAYKHTGHGPRVQYEYADTPLEAVLTAFAALAGQGEQK